MPTATTQDDRITQFKTKQRQTWALGNFADIATFTTVTAGHLVRYAQIQPGQKVLDVATGTGVVAITAARGGAQVTGLDLTPELLAQARVSAEICQAKIRFDEGDAEALPYEDASFDVVLSQFGHMFAPRPEVVTAQMLRVLKPGGRLALATWAPEGFIGQSFTLTNKYIPSPEGIPSPVLWGDPDVVRKRLGDRVRQIEFENGNMPWIGLSPQHLRVMQEAKAGPFIRAVQALKDDPATLERYRREYDELIGRHMVDNVVPCQYLLTRAVKA